MATIVRKVPLPESRHKYLYERLGDHDFQQLVGALLTLRFSDFVPLPLRQADGGRDGVQIAPQKRLVYQVKWSADGTHKNPVDWLDKTITQEADTIRRLASEGTRKYVIVTNVSSTGKAQSGTFDKLNRKLKQHTKDFGLEMGAFWREALDPMVDSAPTETKWAYADMLAGWDLIRYLVSDHVEAKRDANLRDVLRRVAAAQWAEDVCIKFSQVTDLDRDLDRERLSDLFVDVPAQRIEAPRRAMERRAGGGLSDPELGGAAAYIMTRSPYPLTLVRGAPGQGKSTLGQFICQTFRVAFMPKNTATAGLPTIEEPRFPLRLDLGDYAAWMRGIDVFDTSESVKVQKGKKRPAAQATVECFLADLISHYGGGSTVNASDVQDMFKRVPSLLVLDGLDEVGSISARQRVVREIGLFCARGNSYAVEPRVIVTSRPNSAGLPEPDSRMFEIISLSPLDDALRDQYLRKWCGVHKLTATHSRTLRRNFHEKTREPYIGELAGNPMQLTILLSLLRQHGDATPSQRTELYDYYMTMLLAREANKHPDSVRKHRTDLMEIIPFLGWYLQSRAEEDGHTGRMPQAEVEAAMKHFQRTYGKPEHTVDELFEAATDRLWALTSKEVGYFEFDVQSLREYFAARFLYFNAGEGDPHFDRTVVLRELLRRPYWLNTTRFYGGNASGADIYSLRAGIAYELAENPNRQVRVAAWSLLTDGVFNSRPMEAAAIVDALTDDHSGRVLLAALDDKQITALPDASHTDTAWQRLTTAIAADPGNPDNHTRVRVLRDLLGLRRKFADWWVDRLQAAIGDSSEIAWLEIGAHCEVAAGDAIDIPGLHAQDRRRAQLILNTGAVPAPNSALEQQLRRAVLDGQCPETTSLRSELSKIAVALSPATFYPSGTTFKAPKTTREPRSQAIQELKKLGSPYATIAALRRFRRGEKGTTYPWSNTSTALFEHVGRCWLVTEIAVIGAASPLRNGYTLRPGADALGPSGHPAALIALTRANRNDPNWWRERLHACTPTTSPRPSGRSRSGESPTATSSTTISASSKSYSPICHCDSSRPCRSQPKGWVTPDSW
ncbi:large ATP-binding protein [Mycobacterium sp. 29Ha]|uniref:NACHT domain-containing protein n=1 Tax=Mycobacterium sp. 29Ha TaxID=2939268 RepID=UPI0029393FD3|nr:large ATP-binding protein [Mycobacterium sp. 29Ha]MDV3133345.1 large ATP-binding protein [Mycobacterium sp. 29Ha]